MQIEQKDIVAVNVSSAVLDELQKMTALPTTGQIHITVTLSDAKVVTISVS